MNRIMVLAILFTVTEFAFLIFGIVFGSMLLKRGGFLRAGGIVLILESLFILFWEFGI